MKSIFYKNEDTGELFKIKRTLEGWSNWNYTLKVFVYGFKYSSNEWGWLLRDYYSPNFTEGLIEINETDVETEKEKAAMLLQLRK